MLAATQKKKVSWKCRRRKKVQPNKSDDIIVLAKPNSYNGLFHCGCSKARKTVLRAMNRRAVISIASALVLVVVVIVVALAIVKHSSSKEEEKITGCLRLGGGKTCHSTNSEPYRLYGTKTAYHISLHNVTNKQFHFDGCVPKVFYLLSRHATRYPDREGIEEMIDILPIIREKIINASDNGKSNLCKLDVEKLKSWNMTMLPENDNSLSKSGEQEAFDLAKRYKTRFPEMLDVTLSAHNFSFQYTSRERTASTAQAFAKGLFGIHWFRYYSSSTNDEVLQFHKTCKKFQKACEYSLKGMEELEKFENSTFIKSLVSGVSKRLGFQSTYGEVQIMYEMCRFSYALGIDDIWCSVFSTDDLKVLEYEGDIDDYYKDGYGNEINYKQACPVVNFLVQLFRSSEKSNDKKVVLQFSHAGAIKKAYARLGLYRDTEPPTADNLCSQANRKWKSSLVTPFNSNIAIVLYLCHGEHKIAAFHNEQPVVLGGCKSTLCPLREFLKAYDDISNDCNIKSMCCSCCRE